ALADLALALARPLLQSPFQLRDRSRDEDRDRAGHVLLHGQRPFGLELEHRDLAAVLDPADLVAESSISLARDVRDVLEEVALGDAAGELGIAQEPVFAAV